jgi:glycosyltransferase involved in cell wall biosynthesis
MISIIICSKNECLLKKVSKSIEETIGVAFEIIPIINGDGKFGISEAYNLGASKSKYPYLCFCHEDITFHTANWGTILINHFTNSGARLIGVLGCTVKTKCPGSVYIFESDFNRQNHLQKYPDGQVIACNENPEKEIISEVCILDGMFISSTKSAWEETRFSESYLPGFHGYDIDFSLKNFRLGKILVVYDILLEHASFGSFSKTWVEAQLVVTKKWCKALPLSTSVNNRIAIKSAEIKNLKEFIKILITTGFSKKIIIKYFGRLVVLDPFNSLNGYFIRNILFGKRLDSFLKTFLLKSLRFKSFNTKESC